MSYDLMVFRKEAAPNDRKAFIEWYHLQTEWSEDHSYDDPTVTSERLRNWFMEIIETFPTLNGPFASDLTDDPKITDYSIGMDMIYAGFAWSEAESAYSKMLELAKKHGVGFFNASGNEEILVPDGNGSLRRLEDPNNTETPWWKFWM